MIESPSQPTAEGNLSDTPFAHLVLYLYQHRSSGTLVITAPGASEPMRMLFQRGRGVAARLPTVADALDAGLLPLCQLREASFAFYEDDLVGSGSEVVTGMFDPYAFVAASVRSYPRADAIDGLLARFGDARLRLQQGVDIARFRLTSDEAKLVEVLRADPISIAELCAQSELPADAARRLIYVLIVTKAVAPYEQAVESSAISGTRARATASSAGTTSAPSAESASSAVRRTSSQPAAASHSSQPARPSSQAPQVPATPSALRSSSTGTAWQAIAARAGAAASLRPPAGAAASLRPPAGAAASLRPPAGATVPGSTRPGTPRPSMAPPEVLDLPSKLKRVEQLCQRRSFDEALPLIRAVCAEAPAVAKHQGLLALVLLLRTTDGAGVSKEVVEAVNQALRLHDSEPNALYTKAICYKRTGKDREALHYFKRAVAADSTNIDAAREVRLLSARVTDEAKKTKR